MMAAATIVCWILRKGKGEIRNKSKSQMRECPKLSGVSVLDIGSPNGAAVLGV